MHLCRGRRRVLGLAGSLGLAAAFVVLLAAPAWAHATLENESPTASSTVATAPKLVQLTFDENVEVSFGSIALYNQTGDRVDLGAPHHSPTSDHAIEASVPHLADGTYVLTWRVISADSHPVHGAYTFTVGQSSVDTQSLAAKLEAKGGGNKTVGVAFAIARAAEFAGIALLIGAVVFAAAIRPRARERSRADALIPIGWVFTVVATVAALLLQGPYAGGLTITNVFKSAVVRAVLHTRYGHFIELRLVLLVVALPLLLVLRKVTRPAWWWWALAAPVGLGIAATPGLAGHAATGTFTQLAIPLDTMHVAAMSVWLGGLAALTLVVVNRDIDARTTSETFSRVAFWSVIVIVGSGVFAAWRQVGWSVDAVKDTTYGRLLLVKLAVFVVLLGLAGLSRGIVRARRPARTIRAGAPLGALAADGPGTPRTAPDGRDLRWSVSAELVFGIAVLTITSLLVNSQPARGALALPYSTEFRTQTMLIDLTVAPAKAGPLDIHVYTLTPSGGNMFTPGITAELSLPSKNIAPIAVPLVRAGPNHFLACLSPPAQSPSGVASCPDKFSIPFGGKWLLVIRALRNEFDEVAVQKTVTIR